jgi:hypothetical protein
MKSISFLTACVFLVFSYSCSDIELNAPSDKEAIEIFSLAMQADESEEAIQIADVFINEFIYGASAQGTSVKKVSAMVAMPSMELISEKGIFPESYVIDFGDGYYMDKSNRTIKGKVFFTKSDPAGSTRKYSFSNFYIDFTNIKSSRTVENKASQILTVTANDTITYKNGQSVTREWTRIRTLIDSNGDVSQYWNNSYSFDGSAKGSTLTKLKYQMSIQKPLVSLAGYKYYVSGVVKILTDKGEQFIDFGKGEKDNIVEVKTNGKTQKLTLNWD